VSLVGNQPFYTLSNTYTVGLLTPGRWYYFKYRAINLFGLGAFSTPIKVQAATVPD